MTRVEQNRIVAGAALTSLTIVLVVAAWVAWRHTRPDDTVERAPAPIAAAAGEPDISAIVALAPFGGAAGGPATTLGLVLRATMVSVGGAPSSAVVAAGDQPAVTLYPGQSIGGAVLDSVAMDHVVLRVGGRTETLAFPRETPADAPRPAVSAQAPPPPQASAPVVPTTATPAAASGPALTATTAASAGATRADPVAGASVVDRYRRRADQPARPAAKQPLPPLQRPGFSRDARPGE